jgi:hypothetical protein
MEQENLKRLKKFKKGGLGGSPSPHETEKWVIYCIKLDQRNSPKCVSFVLRNRCCVFFIFLDIPIQFQMSAVFLLKTNKKLPLLCRNDFLVMYDM